MFELFGIHFFEITQIENNSIKIYHSETIADLTGHVFLFFLVFRKEWEGTKELDSNFNAKLIIPFNFAPKKNHSQ